MTSPEKSDSSITNVQIEQMALELFQAHGVINYSFGFDRAIRRAGQCDYSKKRITLSKHFVATADLDQIHQVLLHEVAHALVGRSVGHGRHWKQQASLLGYRHEKLDGAVIAESSAKYLGECSAGHKHYRMRRPSSVLSCKLCAPSFSRSHLISWRAI
jgi:predicted SprT family Zn-dependent metalloprotease